MMPARRQRLWRRGVRLRAMRWRRVGGPIALALLLTLLGPTRASAQSAWTNLSAGPSPFGPGQSIALTASFEAYVDYEYYQEHPYSSPWGPYPIVAWQAGLQVTGSNGYASPWQTDPYPWYDQCFYEGGGYCEAGASRIGIPRCCS